MPVKVKTFKKKFEITYREVRRHNYLKKISRKINTRRETNKFKKIVRSYVSKNTKIQYLKKYTRYKRLFAEKRKSLKRNSGLRTGRTGIQLFKKIIYIY